MEIFDYFKKLALLKVSATQNILAHILVSTIIKYSYLSSHSESV